MKNIHFGPIKIAGLVLILSILACKSVQNVPPSSVPTNVSLPPTETQVPTSTPRPTDTPDVAATQAYNDLFEQVKLYQDKGYISSLDGTYKTLDDFSESWAQMNWYQWWTEDMTLSNFIFNGHFDWSTASPTPEISGCGIVFAVQPNNDHYAVFLDKSRILFLHAVSTSRYSKEVGKTRGTGRVNITSPYSADFSLVVNGNHSYIYVDKNFIGEYTLSADSIMEGKIGYTLYSGTNKDYGTKCEITNSKIWSFK